MPFKSEAQRRFMYANHPEIAKRWSRKYGSTPVGQGGNDVAINRNSLNRALKALNPGIVEGDMPSKPPIKLPTKPPRGPRKPPIYSATRNRGPQGRQTQESYEEHGFIDDTPRPKPRPRPRDNVTGPGPRPGPSIGLRRLNKLRDNNPRNDVRGLKPLLRLFMRSQRGQNFGGKVFGATQGNNPRDFFKTVQPFIKGTPYGKMLRQMSRNMPGPQFDNENLQKRRRPMGDSKYKEHSDFY